MSMSHSLVYGNLSAAEKSGGEELMRMYAIPSEVLMHDIFNMVKTRGQRLKSRAMVNRMARKIRNRKEIEELEQRYLFLLTLKAIPVFTKLARLASERGSVEAVDRLLALIKSAHRKHQQGVCQTCAQQAGCSYGAFILGKSGTQGTPHAQCALFRQTGSTQVPATVALTQGAAFIVALLNPAFAGVTQASNAMVAAVAQFVGYSHDVDYFDATFTGHSAMKELQAMVDKLNAKELVVFTLARTFDEHITKRQKGRLKQSPTPATQMAPEKMSTVTDIMRLSPGAQALPDILKSYRTATKQHTIVEHKKPDEKKQLLYVLVDSSGSMRGAVSPNKFAFVTKGDVAAALALACVKKTLDEKSIMFFRFFAGGPDRLHSAKTVDDLVHLSRQITLNNFDGGSTEISAAVKVALEDIQQGEKIILKSEVLLITDAEDQIKLAELLGKKKSTKVHTLEILDSGAAGGSARKDLQKLSDTYVEIDPNTVDFEKVTKVVPD